MASRFQSFAALVSAAAAAVLFAACGGSSSVPATAGAGAQRFTNSVDVTSSAAWLQPYYNGAHSGYNSLETTITRTSVKNLTQLWSVPTGSQISTPIVVQNNVAYVNSGDGYLYAVNAGTGAQIWKFETYEGASYQDTVLIAGGKIVIPCLVGGSTQQNAMCGVNVATGTLAWSYFLNCNCLPPAGVTTGAVASGNTAVFDYENGSTNSSYVVAVNAKNGAVLWTGVTLPHGPSFSNAAISGGQVFYSDGNGVCAAGLSSGVQTWCTSTGSEPSIAASAGVVYVNTYNSGVYALNASTGAQIWQMTPAAGNYSGYYDPPAIAKGVVYVAGVGFSGNLYALKASTGAQIFNTSGAGSHAYTYSSPSVANGVVYVSCTGGLCAFDSSTGALLYNAGTGPSQNVSPAIVNGVVYENCGPNSACAYH